MTVDPTDGAVYVVCYDRRGDSKNWQQAVRLSWPDPLTAGTPLENFAWQDQPFDAEGVFVGDDNRIAASQGRVYGVRTQKPETRSSRDTVIQIADFSTDKLSSAPSQPARSARTGRK